MNSKEYNVQREIGCHFRHIYLYGAGKYGKRYLELLQAEGICVSAFITTQYEQSTYCGLPVYAVNEISPFITERDWVILAYKGATQLEIEEKFHHVKPQIIYYDSPEIRRFMKYESFFTPVVLELQEQFSHPSALKNYLLWKNILMIRLDAIGDVVCTTALIRELKYNCPKANLTVVVRKETEALLRDCPYIDCLLLYESKPGKGEFIEDWKNIKSIHKKVSVYAAEHLTDKHFDLVFLPTEILCGRNGVDELLLALYSKADCRIGHLVDCDDYRRWIYSMVKGLFSKVVYQTSPMHETLFQLDMLRNCGLTIKSEKTELWVEESSRKKAEALLREKGVNRNDALIAVGIVGSKPTRSWNPGNYNALFRTFGNNYGENVKFVILGGKDAAYAAEKLEKDGGNIVDLTGKLPLEDSVACMERCDIYIGSNTGLLHIADALYKPSVTIYAELEDGSDWDGDSPARYGARREGSIALVPPPGLDGCHGYCKKEYSHCINQITPSQVVQAIEKVLGSINGR